MGHGLQSTDNLAATGGDFQQWHGLGKKLPEGMTAVEGFPLIGIDWPTELAPVFAQVMRNGVSKLIALPDHRAHLRADTDDPLGVVTSTYQEVPNMELAKFLDAVAGQDAASTLTSGGSFYGGRRVFGCIKLPADIRVGADITEQYVVGSNGHGGFAGLNMYPSSVRPICANTLRLSEKDLGKGITFRHTGDMVGKVEQARLVMGLAMKEAERFGEKVRALAGAQLSAGQVREFMALTFVETFGQAPDATEQPEAFEKYAAKREEIVGKWLALVEHETNNVQGIQGSAWQALNAVTYYHDHLRSPKLGRDVRAHSNLFGTSNRDKQTALRTALAMV